MQNSHLQEFAQLDGVSFSKNEHGHITVKIENASATAEFSIFGAHLLSFTPKNQEDLFWVSKKAIFNNTKAIRGGMPICWPWFNAHPSDSTKPAHGFARISEWELVHITHLDENKTEVIFKLNDSEKTQALWPHAFGIQLKFIINSKLEARFTVTNTDTKAFTYATALHSYFNVQDISKTQVLGLDALNYINTVGGTRAKEVQQGPVSISQEVDRIYLDTPTTLTIKSPSRTIAIASKNTQTTVVWNPWIEKAKSMADFGDDEYKEMICVENCNIEHDQVTLDTGLSHTMIIKFSAI